MNEVDWDSADPKYNLFGKKNRLNRENDRLSTRVKAINSRTTLAVFWAIDGNHDWSSLKTWTFASTNFKQSVKSSFMVFGKISLLSNEISYFLFRFVLNVFKPVKDLISAFLLIYFLLNVIQWHIFLSNVNLMILSIFFLVRYSLQALGL